MKPIESNESLPSRRASMNNLATTIDGLRAVLLNFPEIRVAFLFGSMARNQAGFASDLDLGVAAGQLLDIDRRMAITTALAQAVRRPIDLIDLGEAGVRVLRSVFRGIPVVMHDRMLYGRLIVRMLSLAADFEPYRRRILDVRRHAWIGT